MVESMSAGIIAPEGGLLDIIAVNQSFLCRHLQVVLWLLVLGFLPTKGIELLMLSSRVGSVNVFR